MKATPGILCAVLVLCEFLRAQETPRAPSRSAPLAATDGTKVLFLDLEDLAETKNLAHRVCEARKHPLNPLLPLGDFHEWDSRNAMPWATRTLLYDEEERLFKCWYQGTDFSPDGWWSTGYATSPDGVRWEKPELGLHEYKGSKRNNICLWHAFGPMVKDLREKDPEKRYKMILREDSPGKPRVTHIGYSPDGVRWQKGPRFRPPGVESEPDFVALILDDAADPSRRVKVVWQANVKSNKSGPPSVRAKCLAWGPDLEHLQASPDNPVLSPNDGNEQEDHFLALFPAGRHTVMLYEYGWYAPNGRGRYGSYSADIRLAASRDGEHFRRVQPHQKVIPRGRHGEWDDGFLVIIGNVPVKEDTLYLYYCGQGEETTWPKTNAPPSAGRVNGINRLWPSRMGLATLVVDRFACLESADAETPGHATTVPIEVRDPKGLRLILNVSDTCALRSWVDVEILDGETGETIPGFSAEDCVDVARDGLRLPVSWKSKTLEELAGKRIRIRFRICGQAKLYSFAFARA